MFLMKNPFRKKQVRPNPPVSSFRVQGTDIEVAIWKSEHEKVKYRFKLSRIGENGRRFSALSAEDILRLPSVTLRLAEVFLMNKDVDEATRSRLANLYDLLLDIEHICKDGKGQVLHERGHRRGDVLS